MSLYFLPRNPARAATPLKVLRERARRIEYLIDAHYPTGDFSLIDARLHLPIAGLEHVSLSAIAAAIDEAMGRTKT
jgi:hypothetical protein